MNVVLNDKQTQDKPGVHPQKFALWLALASMTMFFAALTSAVLVKKGDYKVWENFRLPSIFLYSTLVVVGLSGVIHFALISYRKAQFTRFRWLMFFSFLLGCLFLGLQYTGWIDLQNMGFPLTGNVAGSFIYIITASHGAHIVGGLVAMLVFLYQAVRSRKDELYELRNIINPKRELYLEMLVTFWHYIDIVWVYLYVFLLVNYQ